MDLDLVTELCSGCDAHAPQDPEDHDEDCPVRAFAAPRSDWPDEYCGYR